MDSRKGKGSETPLDKYRQHAETTGAEADHDGVFSQRSRPIQEVAESQASESSRKPLGIPEVLLETECVLSSHVVNLLGIRFIEPICNQFRVRLQTVGNGCFSVAGTWRDVDAIFRQISQVLKNEATSRAFSLIFAPTHAHHFAQLLTETEKDRTGSTSSSLSLQNAAAVSGHGHLLSEASCSPESYQSTQSLPKSDIRELAMSEPFQINKITYDVALLVGLDKIKEIERDCKVQVRGRPAQSQTALLISLDRTGEDGDVARARSLLQGMFSEVSSKLGETKLDIKTGTDVSQLKSFPWAEQGVVMVMESDKRCVLVSVNEKLGAAEQQALKLLKACRTGSKRTQQNDGRTSKRTKLSFDEHPGSATPEVSGGNNQSKTARGIGSSTSVREDSKCTSCTEPMSKRRKLKCGHQFCKECIDRWEKERPVCPTCNVAFGMITGNQPQDATMNIRICKVNPLPGYPTFPTIVITYNVPSGKQGSEHPHPGRTYSGTSRIAYLPDTGEGRELLGLLKKAFEARLIFTVGRSVTSEIDDTVTWNDIHHKTSCTGGRYGYPDPTYFDRLRQDLKAKGIE